MIYFLRNVLMYESCLPWLDYYGECLGLFYYKHPLHSEFVLVGSCKTYCSKILMTFGIVENCSNDEFVENCSNDETVAEY